MVFLQKYFILCQKISIKTFFPQHQLALRGKSCSVFNYLLFGNIEQHFIAGELNFKIVE